MPGLDFSVASARAMAFAAVPTIALELRITQRGPHPVRSIALCVQVRIAATQRTYSPVEQDGLLDIFGEVSQWGQTLRSLLWTVTTVQVPGFTDQTVVDLMIPCTYDFDVASAKYFDALQANSQDVPLELLFSGTLFYAGPVGLQVEQISWDSEARFLMPVHVWKDVMALYFPNSAWLRVHKDTFDRLHRYRSRNALPTWEAALDNLLDASERAESVWTR